MRKTKYYLETSVFNFKFAEDDPVKQEITENFFDSWVNFNAEMYISDIVNEELARILDGEKRSRIVSLIKKSNPILLSIDEEVKELAERYIAEGIIPVRYRNDALHIAVAVVNDLNVVVSWNLEHIVKLKTRVRVNAVNKLLGYKEIEISTPEEVL